jgi:hypothetical protein
MTDDRLAFLTPYWSGPEMMKVHLSSIRKFHPEAPILVSKKGGNLEEMEAYRRDYGVRYWLEECGYIDALLRLLQRCETEYVCVLDHDTVLLSTLDPLLNGLQEGRYDLVGIEERIREPAGIDWNRLLGRTHNGWWRFAPGYTASNFILFNWREFLRQWGLRGIRWKRTTGTWNKEYDYGISQKLKRHKYLLPFHVKQYGTGNLLVDGDVNVLWHQWYGSYRARMTGPTPAAPEAFPPCINETIAILEQGERAFLADYPSLDLTDLVPAWGPEFNIELEHRAAAQGNSRWTQTYLAHTLSRIRRWPRHGLSGLATRALARLNRWWRLL